MNKKKYILAGKITKTNGLKGDVEINVSPPDLFALENLSSVFLEISGSLSPYTLTHYQPHKKNYKVHFDGVDSIDEAAKLVNMPVYISRKNWPAFEEEDFTINDTIKFSVIDSIHGELGEVKAVIENPGQDLLQINRNGKELLIPVAEAIITNIDRDKKIVYTSIPDGLIEIFS